MSAPTRPLLRWHGGKWILAPWIISHFPPHRVYVEPFGGAFSVGIRKPRSFAEIWNDLDDELVNLMRVLRDADLGARLLEQIRLTPFARTEFLEAYEPAEDPVERARRIVIRSFMGFGSDGPVSDCITGFRSNSSRSGTTPAMDWANYAPGLEIIIERIAGIVLENKPAMQVMADHDAATTLHYVDPPYLFSTRRMGRRPNGVYRHELSDADHAELLEFLKRLEGMVVLSGYPSASYDVALPGWRRVQRKALADGASARTEVLWISPAAQAAIEAGPLFGIAAA